jgi:hypothetical protein
MGEEATGVPVSRDCLYTAILAYPPLLEQLNIEYLALLNPPISSTTSDILRTVLNCTGQVYQSAILEILFQGLISPGPACRAPKAPSEPFAPSTPEKRLPVSVVASFDPNTKYGPLGSGTPRFLSGVEPLRYAISFENLESATAAAQEVVITDQLNTTTMDVSTLSFGPILFGDQQVNPLPGQPNFSTDVDLRPAKNLLVRVHGRLDPGSGLLTWQFQSIDPATGQPTTDPLAGFLPPNNIPPEGQGLVVFTVQPKKGLPTGTQIQNQATIVFDVNPPISTQTWLNTLDYDRPTSHVLPLPATQTSPNFTIQWSGTDVGSGVNNFTVFVSDNGGPFTPFVTNTVTTSATYPGVAGHTYGFFSQARDLAGNIETLKTQAEATTQVVASGKTLASLGPATLWIGLKNSDDQGTQFDLRAEVSKNGTLVAAGQTLCITGVTRNPDQAKQATVSFSSFTPVSVATRDTLSLKVLTRIGTNANGTKCSGPGGSHNNAVGLRLYYDAVSRSSRFGTQISPDSLKDTFLHSGASDFLNTTTPSATSAKFKDSPAVNFNNGNAWQIIGTWSMTLP